MGELISLETAEFNGSQSQCTSASVLYGFLGLSKGQFSRWCKKNILKNEFAFEGTDWVGFDIVSSGNIVRDYHITIDFAKRLSMMARTEKGEEARLYFLQMEKIVKVQKPLSQLEILAQSAQILLEQDKRVSQLEQKVLQIEAHSKTINTDYYTIAGYCHIKGKSVPITQASLLGRKCSKLSKDLDYEVSTTYDARYGTVNLYHLDILSQIIK